MAVDSTVWIDFLNGRATAKVTYLRHCLTLTPIVVCDLVLCEVLRGLRTEQAATEVEGYLRRFAWESASTPTSAIRAAAAYRQLRNKGVTVRKTVDLLIAVWCLRRGHTLLHNDRDFEPMVTHLGLREARPMA